MKEENKVTNQPKTSINDLKVQVYDLMVIAEQKQAELYNIQQQVAALNKQILDIQKENK